MPTYRRYYVAGGTYFFTVVTQNRENFLTSINARTMLRESLEREKETRPFEIQGVVLLPDHLHMIWTLPTGDDKYSLRWSAIKGDFTRNWLDGGNREQTVSAGKIREGRRGVWQPRFFEHTINDEDDFEAHLDYIHYNPVKHGLVESPKNWPWSSFHRYVGLGVYPPDWGRGHIAFTGRVNEDLLE